jgi:hypothetical protein
VSKVSLPEKVDSNFRELTDNLLYDLRINAKCETFSVSNHSCEQVLLKNNFVSANYLTFIELTPCIHIANSTTDIEEYFFRFLAFFIKRFTKIEAHVGKFFHIIKVERIGPIL